MVVTGDQLDPLLGKHVRVYLRDGADLSGVLKANRRNEQRFLLQEHGDIDQVIYYHQAARVENLERSRSWWRRLLGR